VADEIDPESQMARSVAGNQMAEAGQKMTKEVAPFAVVFEEEIVEEGQVVRVVLHHVRKVSKLELNSENHDRTYQFEFCWEEDPEGVECRHPNLHCHQTQNLQGVPREGVEHLLHLGTLGVRLKMIGILVCRPSLLSSLSDSSSLSAASATISWASKAVNH